MAKVIGFTVEVDGLSKSVNTMKELKDLIAVIRKQLENIPFDSPEFDKAAKEAGKLIEQQKQLTAQINKYATSASDAAKAHALAEKKAQKEIEDAIKQRAQAEAKANKETQAAVAALEKQRQAAYAQEAKQSQAAVASLEKQRQAAYAQEAKQAQKAAEIAALPIGSYRALQAELTQLSAQYKALSKVERESAKGIDLQKKVKGLGDELKDLDEGLGNSQRKVGSYKDALLGIGDTLSGGLIAGGIAGIAVAAATAGVELFKLAGTLETRAQKAATVFGSSLDKVTAAADKNANAMGLTRSEYIEAAAASENLFTTMGLTKDQAADFSITLQSNTASLVAFSAGKADAAQAGEALQGVLRGEYDTAQTLGLVIDANTVAERLAAEGKDKLTGKALAQAEANVKIAIIQEQLTNQTKVLADSQGGLSQRSAEAGARFREMAETLAVKLTPLFELLLTLGTAVGQVFGVLLDALQPVFEVLSEIAAVIETVVKGFGEVFSDLTKVDNKAAQTQSNLFGTGTKSNKGATNLFGVVQQDKRAIAGTETGTRRDINEPIDADVKKIKTKTAAEIEAEKERAKKLADIRKKAADDAARDREARGAKGSLADLGIELSKLKGQLEKLPKDSPQLASLTAQIVGLEKQITDETKKQEAAYESAAAAAGIETEAVKKAKEEQKALIEKQRALYEAQAEAEAQARIDATVALAAQQKETLDFQEERAKARKEADDAISEATKTAQQKEIDESRAYYAELFKQADEFAIDTVDLVQAQKDAEAEINDKYRKEQEDKDKEANEKRIALLNEYANATTQVLDTLTQLSALTALKETNKIENEYEDRLAAAKKLAEDTANVVEAQGDDATQAQIQNAENAALALETIEKEKAAKLDTIKREQFERDKQLSIALAFIKGAQAALEIIATYAANPILAAFLLAATATEVGVQVATIQNTEYKADGGFVGDKAIGAPDRTGERPAYRGNIVYHVGEYVAPKKVVQDPRAKGAIEYLEQLRGEYGYTRKKLMPRLYAIGGQVTDMGGFGQTINTSQDDARRMASIIGAAVFEAAKAGTQAGAMQGTKAGAHEAAVDIAVLNARRKTSIEMY